MAPHWAEVTGWIFLAIAFASALVIAVDEFVLGRRQHMWVMNLVHPITALYWGPVWVWAYFTRARRSSMPELHRRAEELAREGADPDEIAREGESVEGENLRPWHVANAASHCGAGCTLGDIGGEWLVWVLGPLTIGATGTFGPELIFDFIFAWTLGIAFQYFTIVPMREDVGRLQGLWLAIRVDTLSILSFQVGLFGWMALSHFVLWSEPLGVTTSAHWWMMQVGMIIGFFTTWPVNRWLVRKGWKEKMDHRTHLAPLLRRARDEGAGSQRRRDPAPAQA